MKKYWLKTNNLTVPVVNTNIFMVWKLEAFLMLTSRA